MNKRQAKKAERKNILLCGITYRQNREILRQHEVYVTKTKQTHSVFRGFDEEEQFLIEIGIYTEDEVKRMYYGKGIEKFRWRQIRNLERKAKYERICRKAE